MRHSVIPAALTIAVAALCGCAEAQVAYTTQLVNLRAGPDRSYPVVTVLAAAQLVDVQGCLGDYRWCDVVAGYNRGWVYAGNLSTFYQSSYVPLATYGAVIGIGVVAFAVDDYWGRYYVHRPWYVERHRWYAPPPFRGRPVPPPHDGGSRWHQQPVPRPHQAAPVTRSHAIPPGMAQRQPPPSRPGAMPDQRVVPGIPGGRPPAGGQRHYP